MLESNNLLGQYVATLGRVLASACVTDRAGRETALAPAVQQLGHDMRQAHERGKRLLFVGNGGSAGICSHLATDFSKNGGMRALALNDSAVLTCLGANRQDDAGLQFNDDTILVLPARK